MASYNDFLQALSVLGAIHGKLIEDDVFWREAHALQESPEEAFFDKFQDKRPSNNKSSGILME